MTNKPDDRIEYGAGFIRYMGEGYFFVEMKDYFTSTLETVKESHKIMSEIQPDGPIFILVDAGKGADSDDAIFEYIKNSDFAKRVKAQAVIVNDLPTRLMGNIFLRYVKNQRHIKLFSDKVTATNWLHDRMNDQPNQTPKKKLMIFGSF